MISGIFGFFKNCITYCWNRLRNLPSLYRNNRKLLSNYIRDIKYKLKNLTPVNLELGIYHLHHNNLNDAILRFNLVRKFFDVDNKTANYLLGWSYFLKNNYEKASNYLALSGNVDDVGLLHFIKNSSACNKIPAPILRQYKNFTAQQFVNNFFSKDIHLPYRLAHKILLHITHLPNQYKILELGINAGVVGIEIRKRFPDHFTLTGVEDAQQMIDLSDAYYPNTKIYDSLIKSSIEDAIDDVSQFDIILSLCNLSYTQDIESLFKKIYCKLNDNGYFGCCLSIGNLTTFSKEHKKFIFDMKTIQNAISNSQFKSLVIDKVGIAKNHYVILVLSKNL